MLPEEIKAAISEEELEDCCAKIEAILFAAGCPVSYEKIASALLKPQPLVEAVMREIMIPDYAKRGIELVCHDEDAVLCSKAAYEETVKTALNLKRTGTLSNSSLEVLAVVARNQPVTKSFIEQVRGVDCSYVVNNLVDKGFLETVGRMDVPGKPFLYSTTDNFLVCFGIDSLDDLTDMIPDTGAGAEGEG